MEKIIYLLFVSLMFISCGGVKTPSGEVDVNLPCQGKKYQSDKKNFRVFVIGKSKNINAAIKSAKSKARNQLALAIETKVKVVIETYSNQTSNELAESEQEMGILSARASIKKMIPICAKTTKDRSGFYRHYLSAELSVNSVVNNMDEKIKSEFFSDRAKFREIFEQEMNK